MTYGLEVVIPIKSGLSTLRTDQFSAEENNCLLSDIRDVVEERREVVVMKVAHYQ